MISLKSTSLLHDITGEPNIVAKTPVSKSNSTPLTAPAVANILSSSARILSPAIDSSNGADKTIAANVFGVMA